MTLTRAVAAKIVPPKVSYFFYRIKFIFRHFWEISIEWMKKLFFFSRRRKKNTVLRLNEWMTCELLHKKKVQKNTPKSGEKKLYPTFLILNEWRMNFFGEKKTKNKPCIFIFPLSGKKKHNFAIWMNGWPMNFIGKQKIRYLWSTKWKNAEHTS